MVRGHRSGLLTSPDYNNLCQCETLEDIKLNLVRSFLGQRGLTPQACCLLPADWCLRKPSNRAYKEGQADLILVLCMQTATDYGPYLANEPSPLHTTTIVDRCTEKLVDDWNKMRTNVRPLSHHIPKLGKKASCSVGLFSSLGAISPNSAAQVSFTQCCIRQCS